tara:strand:+ start:297 stop:737 length:441 start_codon:yes stop_codon:yes gene_type:complete
MVKKSKTLPKNERANWLLAIPATIIYFVSLVVVGLFFGIGFKMGAYTAKSLGIEGLSGEKELIFIHMDGCGHCKNMMPEWEKALKKNNTNIKMRKVEKDENDGPDLCKRYKINGFPTIILLNAGNKVKEYDGERNGDAIIKFLQEN